MRKHGSITRVYLIFIDFQKAYDSVHRHTLWKWKNLKFLKN